MPSRRDGFTLVELSIALVIIGLLIGGILAARSMISTSKISAQVRQIGQFDAGVANFKTKYNYLPGDAPAFGGDGDGTISAVGWGPGLHVFAYEIANFWYCMDQQLFSGPQAQSNPPTSEGAEKNVPAAKSGITGSYLIASGLAVSQDAYPDLSNPQNYYAILGPNQSVYSGGAGAYVFVTTSSANASMKTSDMLALDTKMDDGLANSGNVISGAIGNNGGQALGGIVASPTAGLCSSGSAYQVQNTSYECTPLIRIGAQTGDPQ